MRRDQTCDVCGADTTDDDDAGVFVALDGQPFVCSRAACNEEVLTELQAVE